MKYLWRSWGSRLQALHQTDNGDFILTMSNTMSGEIELNIFNGMTKRSVNIMVKSFEAGDQKAQDYFENRRLVDSTTAALVRDETWADTDAIGDVWIMRLTQSAGTNEVTVMIRRKNSSRWAKVITGTERDARIKARDFMRQSGG